VVKVPRTDPGYTGMYSGEKGREKTEKKHLRQQEEW